MTQDNDMTDLDLAMASFIAEIGESCSQTTRQDFQKRAAFDQARIEELIRHATTVAHGGRSIEVYSLPLTFGTAAMLL